MIKYKQFKKIMLEEMEGLNNETDYMYVQGKFDLLMDLDRKLKSHIFIKSIEINGEKI